MFSSLDGRVHIGNVVVIVPMEWPNSCLPTNRTMTASIGERSDITLTLPHPIYRDAIWTQQSAGCGEAGDQIYSSYTALRRKATVGREMLREWAKYRYGIFDEIGFVNDPVYPQCYRTDKTQQPSGCSDAAILNNG